MRTAVLLFLASCAVHDLSNANEMLTSANIRRVENMHAIDEGTLPELIGVGPGATVIQLGGNPAELEGAGSVVATHAPPILPDIGRPADAVFVGVDFSKLEERDVGVGWMNAAARAALAPNGRYAVIEEKKHAQHMRGVVEAAGFRFVREGRFVPGRVIDVFVPDGPMGARRARPLEPSKFR